MKHTFSSLITSIAITAPALFCAGPAFAQVPSIFESGPQILQAGPEALMQRAGALFGGADADDDDDDRRGDFDRHDRDLDRHDRDDRDDRDFDRHDRDFDRGRDGRWSEHDDPRVRGPFESDAPMRQRRARPTPVDKIGQVTSFLRGPGRSVRGLYLSDGSLVMLRGADMSLARRVQPGSYVRVRGLVLAENPTTIFRASVRPMRRLPRGYGMPNAPVVTPAPVAPPIFTMPAPAPAAPQLFNAASVIRSVLGDRNGLPQTLVLADGTRLAIPASLAQSLAQHGPRTGEQIRYWAQRTNASSPLVLTAIQLANGAVLRAPAYGR